MSATEEGDGSTAVVPTGRDFSADDLALVGDDGAFAEQPSAAAVDAELGAIAKVRRENFPAYRRDARMQARERELLAMREETYPIARAAVASVFRAIPADQRPDFEAGFDALPRGAIDVIREFLDIAPGGFARPASEAELKRFADGTPEGAELVKMWRGKAAQKLGVLRLRIELMMKEMAPEDTEAAALWLDGLPSSQAKAVLQVLAG
jgi:hypothetical protein